MTKESNTKEFNKMGVDLAVILNKTGYIEKEVKDIREKLEDDYVTQDQFEPVKNIVYGMISVVLLAVIGAVVALVIKK